MPPPEKLFIYEIEGRVYPPDDLTGADFLGCWREGDYSYLFFGPPQGSGRSRPGWPPRTSARYSSESVMNYADWEAGQPLEKTSMAGFHLCPVWEDPGPGDRRDRHPHGAGPGLRLRLPPHHPDLPDAAAPGL